MIVLNKYINIYNITNLYILLLFVISIFFMSFGLHLLNNNCIFNEVININIYLQMGLGILLLLILSLKLVMKKYYNNPYYDLVNYNYYDNSRNYNSIQETLISQRSNLENYNKKKKRLVISYYFTIFISIIYFLFMGLYIVKKFIIYNKDEIYSCSEIMNKYVENQIYTNVFIVIITAIIMICNIVCS